MDESKRRFIKQGVGLIAASGLVAGGPKHAEAAEPPDVPASMKVPGAGMGEYGGPPKYESKVTRTFIRSQPGTTGSGASRTPLESLEGMITPERAALRATPQRRARHRPRPASAPHPRHGEAPADLHRGRAPALSDDLRASTSSSAPATAQCSTSRAAESHRRPDARPGVVQRVDRGAAARCCSRRPGVDRSAHVDPGRGRGRRRHEPQRPDGQGDGRRDARAVPERRAPAAGERLSGAPVPARVGRQHEREVAPAPQDRVRADHDQGRDVALHRPAGRRQVADVHVPDGGEVRHHASLARDDAAGRRALSDLRPRVVGRRDDQEGRGIDRRRPDVEGGAAAWPPCCRGRCTRFRLPWKWDGTAAVLKSRATDDTGAVQPEREKFIAEHGHNAIFHFHGIQAWSVATNGEVKHVYA